MYTRSRRRGVNVRSLARNRQRGIGTPLTIEQTLKEIKAIMKASGSRASRKDTKKNRGGRFALTSGAEVKRKNMQQALKAYELALAHGNDRMEIVTRYLDWANAWNKKIRERAWKREPILVPPYLDTFLRQQRGELVTAGTAHGGNSPDSNRKKVKRLIDRHDRLQRTLRVASSLEDIEVTQRGDL